MKYEWYQPAGFLNCNRAIDWGAVVHGNLFSHFLATGNSFSGTGVGREEAYDKDVAMVTANCQGSR